MSEPYTSDCGVLYHGDCLDVLRGLPASSVDSIVTDPPAGIAFMNLDFDNPDSWQYPITKHGFTDGGNRVPAPAIGSSSRNPMCRKCKKHKRGWKTILGCECSEPAFDTQEKLHEIREKFIGFLSDVFGESLRVLKPGGFAIVWSLPRTSHWTATALENAGFEVRDCIYNVKDRSAEVQMFLDSLNSEQLDLLLRAEPTDEFVLHLFGSGFPKSLDVSKAVDGFITGGKSDSLALRKVNETRPGEGVLRNSSMNGHKGFVGGVSEGSSVKRNTPTTEAAKQWSGWGTALKPAVECWWLVRKPLIGTVAANVIAHGTGAINIDGCRIAGTKPLRETTPGDEGMFGLGSRLAVGNSNVGRWPANLTLSHSPACTKDCVPGCPIKILDEQSGTQESGSASRFFKNFTQEPPFHYTAKASQSDKHDGLSEAGLINKHPTVKSQDLMRYLIRLVTPKGGTVLDPFAGSGSTLLAAISEGDRFIGIEQDPEYIAIAKQRLATVGQSNLERHNQQDLLGRMLNGEMDD